MKEILFRPLIGAQTLTEAQRRIIPVIEKLWTPEKRLGYVAGIIASDGPDNIQRNIQLLGESVERIQTHIEFPIFSAIDVFGETGLWDKYIPLFIERKITDEDFMSFWRNVIYSGFITDIFMAPGWERSNGASDEEKIARIAGLKVYYL